MRKPVKLRRPSHDHLRRLLSFFLVLAGGAAYAANKIGSDQLKKNAVTAAKIKNKAVGNSKLQNDAVARPSSRTAR